MDPGREDPAADSGEPMLRTFGLIPQALAEPH
jgi:hypothetical protein